MKGQDLLSIFNEYGSPLYVYNSDRIKEQYNKLVTAFSGHPTRFFYACKALSNVNILNYIKNLGASLDCVSINEVKLGLMAGFKCKDIMFTPNCVDFDEILQAVELNVNINIDNLSMLEKFGNYYGNKYPICIRINPHIVAGGNFNISTGHIDSKFGISIHQLRHIERIVSNTNLSVNGLHVHTGSEIKDIDVFLQGLELMLDVALKFNVNFIDLGSGFKVPYKEDDCATNVNLLAERVIDEIKKFEIKNATKIELWFEPGKYLVSECGYFIVKANVIKQTTSAVFIGVNSGFNHLIRPMFYNSYHKITNISNENGEKRLYNVVGNICETDTFASDRMISEVRENDILVFHNAGAYGFEMSSNFNSRLKPAEVMIENGKSKLIRKRDVFEDLLRNQIFGTTEF